MKPPRALLVISAVLALVSLGLPWSRTYDGPSAGLDLGITVATFLPGYATSVRVFVLAAAVLVVVAYRRGSRALLAVAVFVGAAGWLVEFGGGAGQVVYVAALLALGAASLDKSVV